MSPADWSTTDLLTYYLIGSAIVFAVAAVTGWAERRWLRSRRKR